MIGELIILIVIGITLMLAFIFIAITVKEIDREAIWCVLCIFLLIWIVWAIMLLAIAATCFSIGLTHDYGDFISQII